MTGAPTFHAVFAAMQAAAGGDLAARVALPPEPDQGDEATRLAITVNLLLGMRASALRYQPGPDRVLQLLGAGRPLRSRDIAVLGDRSN